MSLFAGIRRVASLGLLALCSAAWAVPPPARLVGAAGWQQLGQGEARWWGLSLYQAALWAPPGGWSAQQPYALALRYERDFSAERLVAASIAEIERLFAPERPRLERWRALLAQAFPDVRAGDVLVGVHRPGRGAAFYHGERFHFETRDAELAERFFAIWLDPRTRSPELRQRLLGPAAATQ